MNAHWTYALVLIFCTICTQLNADQPDSLSLWSGQAPESLGEVEKDQPRLLKFSPAKETKTGTSIVILPGGAYSHLAMDHEGFQIAKWLNKNGIHAFVCDYRRRGKGYGHPAPMLDAKRAIRTVRSNAKQYGIDPSKIGVLGFSAGGHLASTVATHFDSGDANSDDIIERQSSRPDFAILCYPFIAMGTPFSHKGSQRNLLGKEPAMATVKMLSNHLQVTKDTPPTFLWHCSDDKTVPPENSIVYFQALLASGVPAELHIYQSGGHGIGLAAGKTGTEDWSDACLSWMKRRSLLDQK
ncbi:alpha/beta hydrolase [Mariniblastus sp.]|nr:alpha/beta hydrolase [Mariniblastus sp.]